MFLMVIREVLRVLGKFWLDNLVRFKGILEIFKGILGKF